MTATIRSAANPLGPPTLRLGDVDARLDDARGHVVLVGRSGVHGTLDLGRRRSVIRAADLSDPIAADIYAMLTVASAFIRGRLSRTLLHSAISAGTPCLAVRRHSPQF